MIDYNVATPIPSRRIVSVLLLNPRVATAATSTAATAAAAAADTATTAVAADNVGASRADRGDLGERPALSRAQRERALARAHTTDGYR